MESNLFLQISALLAITISIAFFITLLGQPLMVAYIAAGILSGPLFLNFLNGESHTYEAFAQFGIVLLLFVLGLNLNFGHLKKIGKVSAITGIGQVLFTFIVGFLILGFFDFSFSEKGYLALAITFSSTIIIVKLLNDKRDTESIYGRHTIGLMLVQDIIAILVLLSIGVLSGKENFLDSFFLLSAKGLFLVMFLIVASKILLPKILDRIANHSEFLFIFTIAWCFGVASIVNLAGFSIEIGAVAAGLTLGSSPYQMGISSRIKPLRDFFIVLFFIILGSEMGMAEISQIALPGLVLSAFILIGNPLILYILFRLLKFTRRNSFLSGVTAAQVSEFGFVLVFTGQTLGHIEKNILPVFTLVALVTIFASSYLITYNQQIYNFLKPIFRLFGKDRHNQKVVRRKHYDAWIFGYHRIGWKISQALEEKGIDYAVVDLNSEMIGKLQKKGVPAFFGDVSDVEFLEMLSLEKAKLIVSTFPDPESQRTFISYVRSFNKKALIIGTLNHHSRLDDLYSAGADYVMTPHLLGGQWMADKIKRIKVSKKSLSELKKTQQREIFSRRKALRA